MNLLRIFSVAALFLVPGALVVSQQSSAAKQVVVFAVHRTTAVMQPAREGMAPVRKVTVGAEVNRGPREIFAAGNVHVDLEMTRSRLKETMFKEPVLLTVTD